MSGGDLIARRITLRGRVQGVGFRYFVLQHAQRLGVQGWVRNREDGDVEAYFEGESEAVEKLIGLVCRGPSFSHVTEVEQRPCPPQGAASFTIRH